MSIRHVCLLAVVLGFLLVSTRACSSAERALSLSLPSSPLTLSLCLSTPPLAVVPPLSIPRSLILTHTYTQAPTISQ